MSAPNTPPFDAQELLDEIRSWVVIESPTTDPAAVNRMVDKVEADARTAKTVIKRVHGRDGYGDHLMVSSPWGSEDEPGILVLSHLDTVHAMGTLAGPLPFKVEGDIAFGPGIYDMKGGAFIASAISSSPTRRSAAKLRAISSSARPNAPATCSSPSRRARAARSSQRAKARHASTSR